MSQSDEPTRTGARRPPSVLLALVLSGLAPGLGHLYVGRPQRGAAWLLAVFLATLAWMFRAASSYTELRALAFPPLILLLALIVDSGRLAHRDRYSARRTGPWDRWWAWLGIIAFTGFLAPAALFSLGKRLLDVVVQPDDSMAPLILPYDRVMHEPLGFLHDAPQRGEIVVVQYLQSELPAVRRLVALPGDEVEVRRGVVLIGGRERAEDYRLVSRYHDLFLSRRRLGNDEYLVLGDRRDREESARCVVEGRRIVGRARYVLYPADLDILRMGQALQ